MSTQAPISDLDVDRPPAGTECCSCKAAGHFCPASQYVNQTDLGICDPCREGRDCEVAKRLKDPEMETVSFQDAPPPVPPGCTIPKEEWPADTSIHETKHNLAEVPFGIRSEIRAEQNGSNAAYWKREFLIKNFTTCTEFFVKLSGSLVNAVHYAAIMAPDPSWFVLEETATGTRMLLDKPIFHPQRETAHALATEQSAKFDDADFHLMIWHGGKSIAAIPKVVAKPKPLPTVESSPRCGCGRLASHQGRCSARRQQEPSKSSKPTLGEYVARQAVKVEKREQAKELLVQGNSTREVAAAVGLSLRNVVEARKEVGLSVRPKEEPVAPEPTPPEVVRSVNEVPSKLDGSIYERTLKMVEDDMAVTTAEIDRLMKHRQLLVPALKSLRELVKVMEVKC